MDNWGTEEKKKGKDITRIILLVMIIALVVAIIIIAALLMVLKQNTFRFLIDDKPQKITSTLMQTDNDGTVYISISEIAPLLGYKYHVGEYKVFSSDQDKCYVESTEETASFYLNSNKIAKVVPNVSTEDYEILTSEKNIIQKDGIFYAPLDAIEKGFNVSIIQAQNGIAITTLNTLLTNLNTKLNPKIGDGQETAYQDFEKEENLNNRKAALYDYIVINSNSSGLYGVITTKGTEILADKYQSIQFLESTQEFIVTNSLGKMGIIDTNGVNIIEQNYDNIKLINNSPRLYMVTQGQKYGVLGATGDVIIYPEYDSIGVDASIYANLTNQYVLLDKLIPVCLNKKYGAFDITGKEKIIDLKYDGFGFELNKVTLKSGETSTSGTENTFEKPVNPVVAIEECNGVVVKEGTTYGLLDATTGKILVPTRTDGIYYITSAGENIYYMAYKGNESNLIETLIERGIIPDPNKPLVEETGETANITTTENQAVETTNTLTTNQVAPALNTVNAVN